MIRFLYLGMVFCGMVICLMSQSSAQNQKTKSPKGVAIANQGTPVIDAEIDDSWKKCPKFRVNQPIAELLEIDAKEMATATVRLLWDEKHLYVLWVVKDSMLSAEAGDDWAQDSVELFLYQNQAKSTTYEADDAQYRVNYEGRISGQGTGYAETDIKAVTKKNKMGYIVEMAIRTHAADMKSGTTMGIEFQVNDERDRAQRDAIAKWFHTEDDSWNDTSTFGTIQLK